MNSRVGLVMTGLCVLMSGWAGGLSWSAFAQEVNLLNEILYLNNRGIALLDQYKFTEAAEAFQTILEASPQVVPAQVNLGIAYFYDQKYEEASQALLGALEKDPEQIQSHYVLGLIYRNQDEVESAIRAFLSVNRQDPQDPSTNYYLGRLCMGQRDYATAADYFQKVIRAEPYNASAHYNLAQALTRGGDREAGMKEMNEFRRLQQLFGSTTVGLQYLEQGEYAIAIQEIADSYLPGVISQEESGIQVSYTDSAAEAGIDFRHSGPGTASLAGLSLGQLLEQTVPYMGSGLSFGDFDKDGWMDLYIANAGADQAIGGLFRNAGDGSFEEITAKAGLSYRHQTMHSIWGDYDNDSYPDLYLINYGPNTLYQNQKDGTFLDVTDEAGIGDSRWGLGGSFVDFDHDGDLDLAIANFVDIPGGETKGRRFPHDFSGSNNALYRNNGDGTFTDVSAEAGLAAEADRTTTILASDFDNSRDVDFYTVNFGSHNRLLNNLRDGSFLDASRTGAEGSGSELSVGVGDINGSGFVDLFLPSLNPHGSRVLSNQGHSLFEVDDSLASLADTPIQSAQLFDFDNDSDLDILLITGDLFAEVGASSQGDGFVLIENREQAFVDITARVGLEGYKDLPLRGVSVCDYDKDGDLDVASSVNGGRTLLLRNNGGNSNNWISLKLVGTNSNKSGIGAKAEIRSGKLWQKLESMGGHGFLAQNPPDLHFGLGKRDKVDIIRLLWPNGVLQSEIDLPANQTMAIQELDRKGTSCPIMYVWNGERYEYQTDFLGGSAYGSLLQPGSYNYPDTDEYVKLNRDDTYIKDRTLAITTNNQLEEVILFDQLELVVVDHPADYEVFPDEKLLPGPPYQPFRLFTAERPHPPVRAVDGEGRDVLQEITFKDRSYPPIPETLPFKGYADMHEIILDLGQQESGYVVLLMHAWIDYADSSSNLAASQAGIKLVPPYLQVQDSGGDWVTAVERMGFPAGLPKTMTVDLSDKFVSDSRKIRILTNMKIHWDQILVESGTERRDYRLERVPAKSANLRYGGYPEFSSPDGRAPKIYSYDRKSTAEWKVHVGAYTKFGEVLPLLRQKDDMFVITRSGDEIRVEFDLGDMPTLPDGWVRDYLVYVDGFGKDMDPNSASPHFLGPLPFHGMSSYPYTDSEQYPTLESYRRYLEEWNTRVYDSAVPELGRLAAEEE